MAVAAQEPIGAHKAAKEPIVPGIRQMQTWTLLRCMDTTFHILQSFNSSWEGNHRQRNERTVCTKPPQLCQSQQGLSQWKSHFPFGFRDVTPFTWMPARRTKYPFHSKCRRKARLFPREVFHPLAERVRQHSERFTNGYFFSSSLFSCSISLETTGIAHLKNPNKPFIFHTKTNWGVCVVMTQTIHVTPCSQNHLGWEWELALCLKRRTLSNSRIFEKCSAWTSAQTKTKHCMLGLCTSAICLKEGSDRSKCLPLHPASAGLDLSVTQWNRFPWLSRPPSPMHGPPAI